MNPIDYVEDKCHGRNHVGISITELIEEMMDMGAMFSLRVWPQSHVFHNG